MSTRPCPLFCILSVHCHYTAGRRDARMMTRREPAPVGASAPIEGTRRYRLVVLAYLLMSVMLPTLLAQAWGALYDRCGRYRLAPGPETCTVAPSRKAATTPAGVRRAVGLPSVHTGGKATPVVRTQRRTETGAPGEALARRDKIKSLSTRAHSRRARNIAKSSESPFPRLARGRQNAMQWPMKQCLSRRTRDMRKCQISQLYCALSPRPEGRWEPAFKQREPTKSMGGHLNFLASCPSNPCWRRPTRDTALCSFRVVVTRFQPIISACLRYGSPLAERKRSRIYFQE